MARHVECEAFRLADLPVELIDEIIDWAQVIWRQETLSVHSPHAGVQRFATGPPQVTVRPEVCCRNVDHKELLCCLKVSMPDLARSPAHCIAQTSRSMRAFMIAPNKRIWAEDNILYKSIAERSGIIRATPVNNGTSSGGAGSNEEAPGSATTGYAARTVAASGPVVGYGARTLIAPSACACLLPAMRPFYPRLEHIKVRVTWDIPNMLMRNVEEYFWRNHDQNSPLQHLDLEIFACPRARVRPPIRAVLSNRIRTSRTINIPLFFFSASLTSLYIYMPFGRAPRFGTAFWEGLGVCAPRLEYLTLDAADGAINGVANISLPELRYLRVVLPAKEGSWLLRSLTLPATLDLHLEPVVSWRRLVISELAEDRQLHEVPFEAIEQKVEVGHRPAALWRYMAALAAPDQTSGAFQDPPEVNVRPQSLWQQMTTAGIDVRLDPSTTAFERACRRFPEYISIVFTDSLADMLSVLSDVGRDWTHSAPPVHKLAARRSVSVRDGDFNAADRDRAFEAQLVKPVYDCMRYMVNQAVAGPFTGNCLIVRVMFHPSSSLPNFSIGWLCALEDFNFMEDLHLLPVLFPGEDAAYTPDLAGYTAPVHLEALATYLNDIRDPLKCPCPLLQRIHVRRSSAEVDGISAMASRWETRFNTAARLSTGVPLLEFYVTTA